MKIRAGAMTLYAVTDRSWLKPGEALEEAVEELLKAGVTCVQLREKEADDGFFLNEALKLKELCRQYQVPLIINGVHVGLSDMGIEKARELLGEGFIIGGSAHNVREALAAQRAGADYIGCGAVFGSRTKKDATVLQKEELKTICRTVEIPVAALGGIQEKNIRELAGTGIDGVAVISALFAAGDKTAAAKRLLELIKGLKGGEG